MEFPTYQELKRAHRRYRKEEQRDPMYKIATLLVEYYWGKYDGMADSLGVLLLTWNQAFYRYGALNYNDLRSCIKKNFNYIKFFRNRKLIDITYEDEKIIKKLFKAFNNALKRHPIKGKNKKSPVSVAKALHLLAPDFFPIWDNRIAVKYDCNYYSKPAMKYLKFCKSQNDIINKIGWKPHILKLLDEYNYCKFTKGWI